MHRTIDDPLGRAAARHVGRMVVSLQKYARTVVCTLHQSSVVIANALTGSCCLVRCCPGPPRHYGISLPLWACSVPRRRSRE